MERAGGGKQRDLEDEDKGEQMHMRGLRETGAPKTGHLENKTRRTYLTSAFSAAAGRWRKRVLGEAGVLNKNHPKTTTLNYLSSPLPPLHRPGRLRKRARRPESSSPQKWIPRGGGSRRPCESRWSEGYPSPHAPKQREKWRIGE